MSEANLSDTPRLLAIPSPGPDEEAYTTFASTVIVERASRWGTVRRSRMGGRRAELNAERMKQL